MASTVIVTQTSADEIRTALEALANNLEHHRDSSLAKAHGLTVIAFAAPVYDANGNDIQYYRDSAGQVVGTVYLRLIANDTIYYAPAKVTTLDGQPTQASLTTEDVAATRDQIGKSAWITEFSSDLAATVQSVDESLLIPHTEKDHSEAHGILLAYPKDTYDSSGHKVGRYVVVFQYQGTKYELVCDRRLGGPPQVPVLSANPTSVSWSFGDGEGYEGGTSVVCTATGSRPFTFQWFLLGSSSTWLPLTNPDGSKTTNQESYDGRLSIGGFAVHSAGQSVFQFDHVGTTEGGNNGTLKCVVTNEGGTAEITIGLYAKDETSCAMFSASAEAGFIDETALFDAVRYRMGRQQESPFATQQWGGYIVLGEKLAPVIKAGTRLSKILFTQIVSPLHRYMLYDTKRAPFSLRAWVVGKTMKVVFFLTYLLNRKLADERMESIGRFNLLQLYKRKVKRLRKIRTEAERRSPQSPS